MEYLFHLGPPLPFFSCRYRLLHWLHDGPPLLSFCMCSHLVPVGLQVASVVFEITEQDSISEVDRIIPDLAFVDHAQNFRPDRCVIAFVTFLTTGFEPDHHSESLHRSHLKLRSLMSLWNNLSA